jgi:hypothetical protein
MTPPVVWTDEMTDALRRLRSTAPDEIASMNACAERIGVGRATVRRQMAILGLPLFHNRSKKLIGER